MTAMLRRLTLQRFRSLRSATVVAVLRQAA